MIGLVVGPLDPGASVALTMADAMAMEDNYAEALWWLEVIDARSHRSSTKTRTPPSEKV